MFSDLFPEHGYVAPQETQSGKLYSSKELHEITDCFSDQGVLTRLD